MVIRGIGVETKESGISRLFLESVCFAVSKLQSARVDMISVFRRSPGYVMTFEGWAGSEPFSITATVHELAEHSDAVDSEWSGYIAKRIQEMLGDGERRGVFAVWPCAGLTPGTRKVAAELLADLSTRLQSRLSHALSGFAWNNPRHAGVDDVLQTLSEMDKYLADAKTAMIDAWLYSRQAEKENEKKALLANAQAGMAGDGI